MFHFWRETHILLLSELTDKEQKKLTDIVWNDLKSLVQIRNNFIMCVTLSTNLWDIQVWKKVFVKKWGLSNLQKVDWSWLRIQQGLFRIVFLI